MKYIIGNQKNYLSKEEAINFSNALKSINSSNEVIICPSDIYMPYFEGIKLCSQNVSFQSNGPFTGEITAKQLKSMNINYSLVGHSERRINLNESNEHINKKINELLNNDIIPILCIGENRVEKANYLTKNVLSLELVTALEGFSTESVRKVIVAYEPIWAISDGVHPSVTPTNDEIYDIIKYIKDLVLEKYNTNINVLYGGSVNPNNIVELNKVSNVDGYLIGGASKNIDDFITIIDKTN